MKLKNKIFLAYFILFLILFLSIGALIGLFTRTIFLSQREIQLATTVNSEAEEIEYFLNGKKEVIAIMAASTVFRDFLKLSGQDVNYAAEQQRSNARLNRTVEADPEIETMELLDVNGKVVAFSNEIDKNQDKSTDPYFINAKEKEYFKDIYDSSLGFPVFAVSSPIFDDATKKFLGVIVARIKPDILYEIVGMPEGMGKTGETFLVNRDRYFLSPSKYQGSGVILKEKLETVNIDNCFATGAHEAEQKEASESSATHIGHQAVLEAKDYRGVTSLVTHAYIPETGWCLVAKMDRDEALAPIRDFFLYFSGIGGVALLLLVIVNFFITSSMTRTLEDLMEAAERFRKGDFNVSIKEEGNDEMTKLAQVMNLMAKELKGLYGNLESEVQKKTEQLTEVLEKMKDQNLHLEKTRTAMLNIMDDLSKEKGVSEKRALDLQKFQLAVENASDHIVITDTEGLVLYANPAVERITGFAPSDIIGKKAGNKDLWGGLMDLPFYQLLWKTIKSDKKVFAGEVNNRRRNGEKYVALASISPVVGKDGSVSYFVGIERDVTKEKEIDRMKTEFISLASHQLRTPLSAMKWFGEMLLHGDAGVLSTDQKEMVGNIYSSNERMIELVNSLLNISRIESGRLMVDPKPTDAGVLVQDVVKTLKQKFDEKNQTVVVSVHEHLPLVPLDPKLIREVYANLITNAIKYTPKGGDIQIFVSKNDTDLVSQVTDNGYGIPKEEQGRVFQKFFRAQNIVKMETEGTGLGLYLTKSVVESSGGKIWFTSDEGKGLPAGRQGTTFFFTIPLSGMTAKKGDVGLEEKKVTQSG
jgi:PAS domain S-box-containing protein